MTRGGTRGTPGATGTLGLSLMLVLAFLLVSACAAATASAAHRSPSAVTAGRRELPREAKSEFEHGTVVISCTGVTWSFKDFPEASRNTVTESLFVDHSELSTSLAVFDGITGSHTVTLLQAPGHHLVKVHAKWRTNGIAGHVTAHAKLGCPAAPSFSIEDLQALAGGGAYTTSPITAQLGQTVNYETVVRNTGNVAITLSSLSDPRCDTGTVSTPTNPLEAGANTAYLCSHVVTAADVAAGSFSSAATVVVAPPEGDGESITHTGSSLSVTVPGAASHASTPALVTQPNVSTATPKSGVLGSSSAAAPALTGPKACVRSGFAVSVKASGLASVTFYLDGHKLRVMSAKDARNGKLTIVINAAKLTAGRHKLLARFTLAHAASSASLSRTLTISRCKG